MKNNIIKDDREITMKAESLPPDISADAESITTVDGSVRAAEASTVPNGSLMPTAIASPVENHNLSDESCAMNTETPINLPDPTEPMMIADEPVVDEPVVDPAVALQSTQTEVTAFFENAKSTATEFFNNNRQLFITLGWIVLAILGAKVVFATLGIIDDIPLVTPVIKLVGLVSVVRFAWRYLIREHDRQELIEIIDRTKVEVLGEHN